MTNPKINTISPSDITEYDKTSSDILKITEDKLKLKLKDLEISIKNKSNLFGYIGIGVTLLITLTTTNFDKEFLTISKDVWHAVFIIGFIIMIILSIKEGISLFKNNKTIDKVIEDIKKSDF